MSPQGHVYLLGAGPGDPELITWRALRILQEADVVLYDALVHPDLLSHCKASARVEFIGKRAGQAHERQASINKKMLDAAKAGHRVVRLKGGDPFLFGRGSEEAEFLAEHGIAFDVVPGVPSHIAASAYTGISLTHRDLASSVAYVTATEATDKNESSHDWSKLATATQTLVIFMGMRQLDSLMQTLIENGRASTTPAAVVQWASVPAQRVVMGTVADIVAKARAAKIGMPALTLVGEVVTLHDHLRWFEHKSLFGKRILITRPYIQARPLAQMLRDHGAEPIILPTIRIAPPGDISPLQNAVANANTYSGIIFTSQNAVHTFFSEMKRQHLDARHLKDARVFAIGPATAQELENHGMFADVVPEEYRGEQLADSIRASYGHKIKEKRFLLPRAAVARDVLPNALRDVGAKVDVVTAYQTLGPTPDVADEIRRLINQRDIDIITLTSSSTVKNLVHTLGPRYQELLQGIILASIGPVTTAEAERLALNVAVTAGDYTTTGLVQALTFMSGQKDF